MKIVDTNGTEQGILVQQLSAQKNVVLMNKNETIQINTQELMKLYDELTDLKQRIKVAEDNASKYLSSFAETNELLQSKQCVWCH